MATSKPNTDKVEDIDFTQVNRQGDTDTLNSEEVINSSAKVTSQPGDTPTAVHNEEQINTEEQQPAQGPAGPQPGAQPQAPEEKTDFNPDFHDLDETTQTETALLTAQALVHAYAQLKLAVPALVSISEKKLKKMDKAGEIDMHMQVRENRHLPGTISILQVVERFNTTLYPPFETSQQFKDTVIPILADILKTDGFALTPKQTLGVYLAEDLFKFFKAFLSCMGDRRELIDNLKDLYQQNKAAAPAGPVMPDVTTAPPPQQAEQPQYQTEPVVEDPGQSAIQAVVSKARLKAVPGGKKKAKKKPLKK